MPRRASLTAAGGVVALAAHVTGPLRADEHALAGGTFRGAMTVRRDRFAAAARRCSDACVRLNATIVLTPRAASQFSCRCSTVFTESGSARAHT